MKRENTAAGILDRKGAILDRKGANLRSLFCTTPNVLKLYRELFWNILKKYWAKKYQEGTHQVAISLGGWACGPPGQPPVPIFCYMKGFELEKIEIRLLEWRAAVSRWNLGRSNLGLRRRDSAGETSLREGEIKAIVITNDPLIEGGGSISINIFTSTISSQTLVHLLYSIFVSKPQIGTCGLLAVLITPCSWC